MRIKKWIAAAALGALALCLPFDTASAGKLDAYRNMLVAHNYTISYENITPPERIHNRDAVDMTYSFGRIPTPQNYAQKSYSGMIVAQGEKRYVEVNYGGESRISLRQADKTFSFKGIAKKDKVEYKGMNGGKEVTALKFHPENELLYGESFGTSEVSRLLGAMLPASSIPAGLPVYQYVGAGNLGNGLSYEDYRASSSAGLEAIRYYFEGTKLVRIASASYDRDEKGNLVGHKCILKIKDFSAVPDASKLALPENLKVVDHSQQDKGKKKHGFGF